MKSQVRIAPRGLESLLEMIFCEEERREDGRATEQSLLHPRKGGPQVVKEGLPAPGPEVGRDVNRVTAGVIERQSNGLE